MSQIQSKFNEISKNYDSQRRKLIPCFDEFYGVAVSVAEVDTDRPKILDIGAGTGILSAYLLEKYPEASITLIDFSEKMLDVARERFSGNENMRYISADYNKIEFQEDFDMVVSALSIHHLEDGEKKQLYKRIYSILRTNGIIVNADQVMGETAYIDSQNRKKWKESIEASGLSKEEILSAYERMKLDKESPVSEQLTWLENSGFADVCCMYKYYNFAVMFGRKI